MTHLGDKDLVSMHVHASIDVAGTEVLRLRHAMCLDPTDCAWIADQNFILAENMALVLSPYFCTLTQMFSCLPNIYGEVPSGTKTGCMKWEAIQSPS